MKALIAMSGGVDSSVAAKIMIDKGYECIGCTMKLFEAKEDKEEKSCCSLNDVEDARSIANRLNIPFYVMNFKEEFEKYVIRKFVSCYECGITPNPCIDCNKYLKFGKLYERAKELGCDKIVTGHYVRIEEKNGQYYLKKALDSTKDQSYVLYGLTQEMLSHTEFPLGEINKSDARVIAEDNGFVNANKKDSQDICFVPDGDYASVIERYSTNKMEGGNFVDLDGNILGRHKGIIHYTLGQRKGLGLSLKKPMYVCGISVETNEVILGDNDDLFKYTFEAEDVNWVSGDTPKNEVRCLAKVRYRHKEEEGRLVFTEDGKIRFTFDEPQRAITPGQAAVFYDGDIVLGGGVITKAID